MIYWLASRLCLNFPLKNGVWKYNLNYIQHTICQNSKCRLFCVYEEINLHWWLLQLFSVFPIFSEWHARWYQRLIWYRRMKMGNGSKPWTNTFLPCIGWYLIIMLLKFLVFPLYPFLSRSDCIHIYMYARIYACKALCVLKKYNKRLKLMFFFFTCQCLKFFCLK
jgi:hypothetical protein